MSAWLVWLVVAAIAAIGEMLTLTLWIAMVGLGAVVAMLVALAGAGTVLQLLAFVGATALFSALLRPLARRHLHVPVAIRSGAQALVGERAVVLTPVDADGGRVRLKGEVWSARAFHPGQTIAAGSAVDVIEIDGATAVVLEREEP